MGQLANVTEPAKNQFGLQANWDIQTDFDARMIWEWLKSQVIR